MPPKPKGGRKNGSNGRGNNNGNNNGGNNNSYSNSNGNNGRNQNYGNNNRRSSIIDTDNLRGGNTKTANSLNITITNRPGEGFLAQGLLWILCHAAVRVQFASLVQQLAPGAVQNGFDPNDTNHQEQTLAALIALNNANIAPNVMQTVQTALAVPQPVPAIGGVVNSTPLYNPSVLNPASVPNLSFPGSAQLQGYSSNPNLTNSNRNATSDMNENSIARLWLNNAIDATKAESMATQHGLSFNKIIQAYNSIIGRNKASSSVPSGSAAKPISAHASESELES